jgi:DNA-directed RNA polymerase specialized sigma24 family protein
LGAVKIDTNAKERSLEAKYPALDNPAGLRILLSDYHALLNRQYQGDYSAVDILVDLRRAIDMAQLTGRQSEALRLVYEEDLTQEEAGKRLTGPNGLGIRQDVVSYHVDRAIEAVAEVYWYWARHDEGYSVGTTKGAESC